VLANVYAGYLWMLLEAAEAVPRATPYLAAAERGLEAATPRERLNVGLLRAWVGGDLATALRLCDRISDEFPRDLVVLKLHQYLEFNRGNFPEMLRIGLKAVAGAADVAYAHGMAAFAYEQCHLLAEAEAAARTALAASPKEPWAQHALAHVLLTRGEIDAGARFLESCAPAWTNLNSFMSTHLWWHLALFYLSQGRAERVLELYDRHCWAVAKAYSQDQVGAVSLLARVELAGVDVGTRWQELGSYLAARAQDTLQPFLSMQYLYGLARARRPEAASLMAAVEAESESAPDFTRAVWRDVALPGCRGLRAHADGDAELAWEHLSRVLPRLVEIGGSHAQRDLFEQILLDAERRSGRWLPAQQGFELRRSNDPCGVPVNTALAEIYAELRLPDLARAARRRADATMPERDPSALYELAAVEALGDTESVFAAPRHAFTAELIRSTLTR
jgi:tetratricopeptide (TPR) repeat protein